MAARNHSHTTRVCRQPAPVANVSVPSVWTCRQRQTLIPAVGRPELNTTVSPAPRVVPYALRRGLTDGRWHVLPRRSPPSVLDRLLGSHLDHWNPVVPVPPPNRHQMPGRGPRRESHETCADRRSDLIQTMGRVPNLAPPGGREASAAGPKNRRPRPRDIDLSQCRFAQS